MNILEILAEYKGVIKRKFGVKKIGVFGSFVRGLGKDDSDVDILVEFEEGYKTFDNYMELKFFLEEIFQRDVDLVIAGSLKSNLRERILKEVRYA